MDTDKQKEEDDERPLCSDWMIWIGREVEGEDHLDEWTLFIRKNLTQKEFDIYFDTYRRFLSEKTNQRDTRVWFTKDFGTWQVLRYAKQVASYVCLEVDIAEMMSRGIRRLPFNLLFNVQLYVKVDLNLKKGDHVCVGKPFADESFMIGKGKRVSPKDYRDDFQLA